MKVQITYREIWRIAWPIMLSSWANTIVNFTDVAFVSRVSESALAAAALGGVFYFIMVMIGIGFGVGSQILIARKAGENNTEQIGPIYDHSVIILLLCAAIMQLLIYGFIPSLMHLLIHEPKIAALTITYLYARGWGLCFMMVLISLRSFYTGIAMTRIVTYTTVVTMVLNVVLNYFLTLGHGGFQAMGIFGTGLASSISETIAAIYAVIYTFTHKDVKLFGLFRFKKYQAAVTRQLLNLASPIVFQYFVSMCAWFIFFLLIEKMGTRDLAVSNIVRSIYMVLLTPIWGFGQACNSMVSNVIGQGKSKEVLKLVGKIARLSVIVGIISTLCCILFSGFLFKITTSDVAIISSAMNSFYVTCVATIIFSGSMILLSAVSGTGDTKAAMFIELVNISLYLIYVFTCTYYFHACVEIVWLSEVIYWLFMGIFSYFYLKSNRWMMASQVSPSLNLMNT